MAAFRVKCAVAVNDFSTDGESVITFPRTNCRKGIAASVFFIELLTFLFVAYRLGCFASRGAYV